MESDTREFFGIVSTLTSNRSGYADDKVADASHALIEAGFNVLGAGSYGIAVEDPENPARCYKVSLSTNDPWREWAKVCARRNDYLREKRKFMPVIFNITEFDDTFVAHMLRYERNSDTGDYEKPPEWFMQWVRDIRPTWAGMDSHRFNYMKGHKGTPVCTDPWCHTGPNPADEICVDCGYYDCQCDEPRCSDDS